MISIDVHIGTILVVGVGLLAMTVLPRMFAKRPLSLPLVYIVFGAVVALRTVTGLPTPLDPNTLIAAGVAVICLTAVAPLLGGNELLDQQVISFNVPLLGTSGANRGVLAAIANAPVVT